MNLNLAWKYNWYRQSELEGALLLGRLVSHLDDPHLVHEITQHAAEEAEHSRLWEETIRELNLPHIRIHRSYQSFYLNHTGPPASLLEVLCFTQIFERRVHRRFTEEAKSPDTPSAARRAYQRMIDDEHGHLSWVASWLKEQPEAAHHLRLYRETDLRIYQELLPYESHIHDIPGLGTLTTARSRELHPTHQKSA